MAFNVRTAGPSLACSCPGLPRAKQPCLLKSAPPHGMELIETMSARQLLTARAASAKNIGLTDFRMLGETRIAKRSYKQRVLVVTKVPPFSSSG